MLEGLTSGDENLITKKAFLAAGLVAGGRTNHWRIYLEVPGNRQHQERFIRLDMAMGQVDGDGNALKGQLVIKSVSYLPANAETKLQTISLDTEPTVGDIIATIVNKRREYYLYHESGQGCRWWCSVVLEDLHDAGYIRSGDLREAREVLRYLWSSSRRRQEKPMREGTFEYGRNP
ncbi:hypothetical protein TWF718_006061 [Orbilia javanica]|uniref:DUF7770 domain-containing protein n=1 Tax=Orbilia javanica TaxID=47235 RepID=A0AAN8MW09_9PEZI